MRVLMFLPQFAPVIGGAERQAERLAKAMVARSVDVLVMTPRRDAESAAEESLEGLRVRRFALRDLTRTMGARPGIGVINGPWIILQIVVAMWKAVGRADVVHCHIGSLESIAAAIAARLRGRPVICKAAMADAFSDFGEMARQGFINRLLTPIGRRIFTRWVATTQAVVDALERAGVDGGKIVVIPNGVQLTPDSLAWRPRPVRNFLYLGRVSTNINRDVVGLIRAFDRAAAQVPGAALAVVGDGDLLESTRQEAAACGHADRIQMPGAGDAAHWLAWADCLVLPSRREGLSNALLEAMAAGLPCIANDIPPNREVLADGECGLLVPVDNGMELERAIVTLSSDSNLAQSLARAARARIINQYTLISAVERYIELYRDISSE
jgi:glycosyltransferase involved in cell wall biosynthesis